VNHNPKCVSSVKGFISRLKLLHPEQSGVGVYKKTAAGELPNLTGFGQEYESPESADLVVDGTVPVETNVEAIFSKSLD